MKRVLLAAFICLLNLPAMAASEGWVVTSCPASGTLYTIPGYAAISVDVNGNQCISGSISFTPSGTQNVNLLQYNTLAVPANGLPTQFVGTAALATGQVSVATTAGGTSIVAARTGVVGTGRKSVCVTNVTGTAPVFIGNTGLTTSTGQYIPGVAGASICLDTQAAIFGIVSATPQTVSFTETF